MAKKNKTRRKRGGSSTMTDSRNSSTFKLSLKDALDIISTKKEKIKELQKKLSETKVIKEKNPIISELMNVTEDKDLWISILRDMVKEKIEQLSRQKEQLSRQKK